MKKRSMAVFFISIFAVTSCFSSGCGKKGEPAKKAEVSSNAGAAQGKAEVKKTFKEGMGGLTVKLANVNGTEKMQKVRVYKVALPKSSSYISTFMTNRMQEMSPGVYDVLIDTTPQMIYKQITVSNGKETVEDIGCVTGMVTIKAVSQAKKPVNFPVRVYYPGSKMLAASALANKPFEVLAGTYDIEIATAPAQYKNGFKVEKGKENVADLGATTGMLFIKALDENGAVADRPVRVKKAGMNEVVGSGSTNRAIELVAGAYDVDILSRPVQAQKNITVKTGEETSINVIVAIPPKPAAKTVAAPKPAAAPKAVKKAK